MDKTQSTSSVHPSRDLRTSTGGLKNNVPQLLMLSDKLAATTNAASLRHDTSSTLEPQTSHNTPYSVPTTTAPTTVPTNNSSTLSSDGKPGPSFPQTPTLNSMPSSVTKTSNTLRTYAPEFGRLVKIVASWARIRRSESKLILQESKAFVGRDLVGYGRKEITEQVTLRDGRVEDRFVRRSARNNANLLLTAG